VVAVRRGVDESCEHQPRPERSATYDPVNYSDAAKELFTELRRLWREQGDDLGEEGAEGGRGEGEYAAFGVLRVASGNGVDVDRNFHAVSIVRAVAALDPSGGGHGWPPG
jgi:hypothetical protein